MPKLLLVEDNEMNRDMLSRRLLKKGYEVLLAVDGEEGVRIAGSDAPDLILMDITLPKMTGWDATRALKSNEKTRAIPVLALTALAMVTDREKAMEAGCDDYDTKPVDLPRLLGKIESLLAKPALFIEQYAKGFNPTFVGMTGTPDDIARVAGAYGVFYQKQDAPNSSAGYLVDHSATVLLIDKQGQLRTIWPFDFPRDDMVNDFRALLSQ